MQEPHLIKQTIKNIIKRQPVKANKKPIDTVHLAMAIIWGLVSTFCLAIVIGTGYLELHAANGQTRNSVAILFIACIICFIIYNCLCYHSEQALSRSRKDD